MSETTDEALAASLPLEMASPEPAAPPERHAPAGPFHFVEGRLSLYAGDCRDVLASLPEASADAVVCDPPYGLSAEPDIREVMGHWLAGTPYSHKGKGFMGKSWDSFVPGPDYWRQVMRVLKPGGHALVFAGTRTVDLMTVALRFAGFEIRDSVFYCYGTGFPKSLDVSKAIDKAAGKEREVVGVDPARAARLKNQMGDYETDAGWSAGSRSADITEPATEDARKWQGWGTALKPAHEPVIVARKPLEGTVAGNVLAFGTGALNIDACRVPTTDSLGGGAEKGTRPEQKGNEGWTRPWMADDAARDAHAQRVRDNVQKAEALGRWPANVMHDGSEEVMEAFARFGESQSKGGPPIRRGARTAPLYGDQPNADGTLGSRPDDAGTAARFFYCAKASKAERGEGNTHPTVKPLALMRWLCRLATPPGGLVLDPFLGSGTTALAALAEGFRFLGIDSEPEYVQMARKRVAAALLEAPKPAPKPRRAKPKKDAPEDAS